jgi:hypothetical protein
MLNTNKTDHHSITELMLTVALISNKTDHHRIADLLLTVVLNNNKTNHHSVTDGALGHCQQHVSFAVVVKFIGV